MPPPLDIIGRRFGKLLVIAKGLTQVSPSGKSRTTTWVCSCDCGRDETIVERRLPHCQTNAARSDAVWACEHCRCQRICLACGKVFHSARYVSTCSDECKVDLKRARDREFKRALAAADPEHYKRINDQRRRRIEMNQELAARHAERERQRMARRSARIKADPEYAERLRAQARQYYAAKARVVYERRKARIAALSQEQRAQLAEAAREAGRRWKSKWRSTPEGAELNRERTRESVARRRIGALLGVGTALQRRTDEGGGDE